MDSGLRQNDGLVGERIAMPSPHNNRLIQLNRPLQPSQIHYYRHTGAGRYPFPSVLLTFENRVQYQHEFQHFPE